MEMTGDARATTKEATMTTTSTSTRGGGETPRPVVLACVDGTADGDRALSYAVAEATRRGAGLRVVHVQVPDVVTPRMTPLVPPTTLHEIAADVVKNAEQHARTFGWTDPDLDLVLGTGPRREAILHAARGAVCVVTGRRSATVDHLLTGSTTAAVAAHASVPVLSVPEGWRPDWSDGDVVVGVEDEQSSVALVAEAFRAAAGRSDSVRVVHAWRPTGIYDAAIGTHAVRQQWTETRRAQLTEWVHAAVDDDGAPIATTPWTVVADYERPAIALVEASRHADLLVVARHGHASLLHPSLGATTRTVLRAAHCPVLVVPTTGHE
jgi:nucleotide-binding universal stress UspA family protein